MKRFLSWLALLVFVVLIGLFTNLVVWFSSYLLSLYLQLSAFLKLVIILFGGGILLGIVFTPIMYGIPLTVSLCEKINESKKGARYIVMGIFILLYSIAVMIFLGFYADQVIMTIYGIVLMVVGRKTAKENFAIA